MVQIPVSHRLLTSKVYESVQDTIDKIRFYISAAPTDEAFRKAILEVSVCVRTSNFAGGF